MNSIRYTYNQKLVSSLKLRINKGIEYEYKSNKQGRKDYRAA